MSRGGLFLALVVCGVLFVLCFAPSAAGSKLSDLLFEPQRMLDRMLDPFGTNRRPKLTSTSGRLICSVPGHVIRNGKCVKPY